jgi:hypothetical protein
MDQTQVLQFRNVFSASYINLHIIRTAEDKEAKLKAAESYLKLGEVSLETGKYLHVLWYQWFPLKQVASYMAFYFLILTGYFFVSYRKFQHDKNKT